MKSIGAIRSRKDHAEKILTGQLIPDKGSAEIIKHDTVSISGRDKKEIGIMMDQFGVYERLSCTDNLRI